MQGEQSCLEHFLDFFFKYPHFFCFLPLCYDSSKRKSGSFCNVSLHKQLDSAVFLQKSKQSWQKTKLIGDIWKNNEKILQATVNPCLQLVSRSEMGEILLLPEAKLEFLGLQINVLLTLIQLSLHLWVSCKNESKKWFPFSRKFYVQLLLHSKNT